MCVHHAASIAVALHPQHKGMETGNDDDDNDQEDDGPKIPSFISVYCFLFCAAANANVPRVLCYKFHPTTKPTHLSCLHNTLNQCNFWPFTLS